MLCLEKKDAVSPGRNNSSNTRATIWTDNKTYFTLHKNLTHLETQITGVAVSNDFSCKPMKII